MKKIIAIGIFLLGVIIQAQSGLSSTENYIYEKNCLTEDCSKKTESVQYFDGLGRAKQTVSIKATPAGKDIAVPVEYDIYGRQLKTYLPVPQSGTQNGGLYADPLSNAATVYGNEKIYAEKVLEASPLNKVLQQKSVGNDWASHPANSFYATNMAGEVKKFILTTSWTEGRTNSTLSLSGTYDVNTLLKFTVTDEDGNVTTSFKNKKGQVVLTRKNDGSQNVDTYYIYDKYGNLAYSIPPLAAKSGLTDQNTLDNLCYQYRYDAWSRLVEKKLPGKGWEYMVYDKQDRLVMTQDVNMRAEGKWFFTKYDQFSRPIYTGILDSPPGRIAQAAVVEGHGSNNESRSTSGFNNNGIDVYYSTNAAYPTTNFKLLSVNYYDTYPSYSFNPAFPTSVMGENVLSDNSTANAVSTKGLPTMSMVKNVEDDHWTKNYVYYDTKGRTIGSYSINHLGGYTKTETDLDFVGSIKKSVVKHKRLNTDAERTITQDFEYDNQGRLKRQYHQVDNLPQELLADNTYNELSQLTNKKVGGTLSSPLQSIDYSYNIKGWTTKINDPSNLNGKLFAYEMKYTNPIDIEKRYNGSITEIDWKTSADGILKRYDYRYDPLNRLTLAHYREPLSSVPYNHFYNEEASYDQNGNTTRLWRNAKSVVGSAEGIDNLTYHYTGNQLTSVTDESANYAGYPDVSGNAISYDVNGNMKEHKDKGILEIQYNFLNLPNYMKFDQTYVPRLNMGDETESNSNTRYTYRADGTKLKKFYTYGLGRNRIETYRVTEYLDGFQYERNSSSELDPQILKFVPTSEGYFNFENNKYIYNYKDHLGNVRVSYFKNGLGAEVLEENNYYPFGLKHGANTIPVNGSYKYQYNGKELQTETGWNDYGWRQYMPELGRWFGMDQLSENYLSTSPYAYVANNPISSRDFDGRWFNQDGSIDTSGYTPGFTTGKQYQQSFLGRTPDEGGGGGYNFSGNEATTMFDYFANGGDIAGLSFKGGKAIWWTGPKSQMTYRIGDDIVGEIDPGEQHRAKFDDKDFFTNLANNQYFSAAHLGVSEANSRFGAYALKRALNPNYVNFTILNDLARPYIGTTVAGIRMSSTAAANISKVAKYGGGIALGLLATAATEAQYWDGQIGETERIMNHIMTGVGIIPSPWTMGAALVYGAVTGGYQAVTGRSIFNDMGLGPQK